MEYLAYALPTVAYLLVGVITVLVFYTPKNKNDSAWELLFTCVVWPIALLLVGGIITFFNVCYIFNTDET